LNKSVFGVLKVHLLSGNILWSALLTHSQQFNEMFIYKGKPSHCNSTITDVRFTLLLAKNI